MIPRFPAYPQHAAFIAPARPRHEIWRLVLGLALGFGLWNLLAMVYLEAVNALVAPAFPGVMDDLGAGQSVPAMYVLLFSFGVIPLGIGLTVRTLHGRPVASLLGPVPLALAQFRRVGLAVAAVALAIMVLPPWDMGAPLVPNLEPGRWAMLLPLSLLAVLVQVGAEEVMFRGYLQQQLAARFRSPLVWMVLPSVLFAVGHYDPEMAGDNAVMIVIWSGVFGILMADLTARSGSLGPAIAVHFCNNVLALLVTSLPDTLSGLALYLTPFGMDDPDALRAWLPADFAQMIVFWLAARLALRR